MNKKRYVTIARNIEIDIDRKNHQKEEEERKKANIDTNNREKFKNRIKDYMSKGMSQEEAVDYLMEKDKDLVRQFDYLQKNGLNLKEIFMGWTNWLKSKDIDSNKGEER